MEVLLGRLTSKDKNIRIKSLDMIADKDGVVDETAVPQLIAGLQGFLKLPEPKSLAQVFVILQNQIPNLSDCKLITPIIPDLLSLLKHSALRINDALSKVLNEFLLKVENSKTISFHFLELGLLKGSEEAKSNSLTTLKSLCEAGHEFKELEDLVRGLNSDPSENIRAKAADLSSLIDKRKRLDFIPDSLILKLKSGTNWKEKLLAINNIETIIASMETLKPIAFSMPAFVSLVIKSLEESHYKVSLASMGLMTFTLSSPELCTHNHVYFWVTHCLPKLGDNKIIIRQAAHKLLRLYFKLDLKKFVPLLSKGLISSNWHIREETLIVFIALMLNKPKSFDYLQLVGSFARLLDDSRPKIRVASTEALAVLSNLSGTSEVLGILIDIMDSEALSAIQQRFLAKNLPILTEDYVVFSKDIPQECRIISSPYLISSPIESPTLKKPKSSRSFQKLLPEPRSPRKLDSAHLLGDKPPPKHSLLSSKSATHLSLMKSVDRKPSYIIFEDLEPLEFPSDSLQKCIFHTEDWAEQFETTTTFRRLMKYNPEIFLSKVTLHNIILNLSKWSESLRSSLAKNSLVALKEMCERMGKAMDSEVPEVLGAFLKKACDSNLFLVQTAMEGIEKICKGCSEAKVVAHIVALAEHARNPAVKMNLMKCFCRVVEKVGSDVVKLKDFSPVMQVLVEYLNDANLEVRAAAKEAYAAITNAIPDESHLDSALMSGLQDTIFRKLKETIKKKKLNSSSVISLSSKKNLRITLPSITHPTKINSARELYVPLSPPPDPETLNKIPLIESQILDMEWKTRYEAITEASELVKSSLPLILQHEKLEALLNILLKGIRDSNLKVLIHALTYLSKLVPVLKKRLEKYLTGIADPLIDCLGCANTSIRDVAWDVCQLLALNVNNQELLKIMIDGMGRASPKGKALVVTLCVNMANGIGDSQFLEKNMLPFAFKFVDDQRSDIRNEAGKLVVHLYKILGKQVLEVLPTSKMHRVISLISNKIE